MSGETLSKVTEIEICGKKYDLARNGKFVLVEPRENDAYGRPVSREVRLWEWTRNPEGDPDVSKVQALLDLLGEAIIKLQSIGDLRRGQIGEEKGSGV